MTAAQRTGFPGGARRLNICSAIDQLPSNLDFDGRPLAKAIGLRKPNTVGCMLCFCWRAG
ncbi:hypothetical protein L209DRAFT_756958 [Thermothelomyces heterothallicus CBS 203.75]